METAAVVFTAGMVGLGLYWFVWVMGSAEQKGKRAVELKMGSISRDKVQDKYKQYWSFFRRPGEINDSAEKEKVPAFVDTFYNLVTDIYEWGWGQSFHFSPAIPGRSHKDATRIHEERVADLIGARPGHKILDVGCGVGGPMRAIAAHSRSNVVGITINEYQVSRARAHNKKAGLDSLCEVVCGNFLQMPFVDSSFDGAYSIEATCHAPKLEEVYGEIYRVLKPGALYASYEWVTTPAYDPKDAEQVEVIEGIETSAIAVRLFTWHSRKSSSEEIDFLAVEANLPLENSSVPNPFNPSKRKGYLSWDDYFMALAFLSAKRSKDPNRQVGACLVSEHGIILGIGYNGFPRGCSDDKLSWAKKSHSGNTLETKYPYVCHAEVNAILNTNHASAAGQKLYVTMFPCNECAKIIIQSGVSEVIYFVEKRLNDSVTYTASHRLLSMAGVKVRKHRPQMSQILIKFEEP